MFSPHGLSLSILRLAGLFLAMFAGAALADDIEQDFPDPPVKNRRCFLDLGRVIAGLLGPMTLNSEESPRLPHSITY